MKYLVSRSDKVEAQSLEVILEIIGFGRFHICMIIILGTMECFEAIEILILSFLQSQLKCVWQITLLEDNLIVAGVFVGMILGSWTLGRLSDIYGRKPIVLISILSITHMGLLCATAPTVAWIIVVRTAMGAHLSGAMSSTLTLASELTPTRHRGNVFLTIFVFWPIGSYFITILWIVIVPIFGWRAFIAITTLPIILLIPFVVWLPESPRFLLLDNRKSEALKILNRIAAINQKDRIDDVIQPPNKDHSFKDVFHKNYLSTTLLVSILWFVCGFTYYGTVLILTTINQTNHQCLKSLTTRSMPLYNFNSTVDDSCCFTFTWSNSVDIIISITGELIFLPISILIINVIGRKCSMALLMVIISVLFIVMNVCMHPVLLSLLFFVLKGSASACFNILILYTSEVFPTSVRGLALGFCISSSRIGAMVSPFIVNFVIMRSSFLYGTMIFSFCNLVALICNLLLPYETKNRSLYQTADDILLTEVNRVK